MTNNIKPSLMKELNSLLEKLNTLDKVFGSLSELEVLAKEQLSALNLAYKRFKRDGNIANELNYENAQEIAESKITSFIGERLPDIETKLVLEETFNFFNRANRPHRALATVEDISREMRYLKSVQKKDIKKEIARKGITY